MCFMDDVSRRSLPAICRASDGGIDIGSYVAAARRERRSAGRAGFSAAGQWLHSLAVSLARSVAGLVPGGQPGTRVR